MKKKLILAAAGAFTIFSLAACSGGSDKIATMKGASITVEDFYNEMKTKSESQSAVQGMIIYKVFEDKYGDKVSKKDIDAEYNKFKKNAEDNGQNVEEYLKQYGFTPDTYKETIKKNLAYQAGVESHIKITDKDLKEAWQSFHPEVEAQVLSVATEDEAKEIKKQLDDGGDFAKIAKEKSTDAATKEDGGKIKFDSTSTTVPAAAQVEAFQLKDGEVSEPIAVTDQSGYQTSYYLVKMIKNKEKGNDLDPYKKQLKEVAKTAKMNDQAFTSKVISDELKEANVKIKDDAFKDVLAGFMQTEESSKDSSAKESSSKEKESSTKESSSKESSSKESSTEESSSKTEDSSK